MSCVQLEHCTKIHSDILYDVLTNEFAIHFPCGLARPMSAGHIAQSVNELGRSYSLNHTVNANDQVTAFFLRVFAVCGFHSPYSRKEQRR